MVTINRDALNKLYSEYVQFLLKGISENQAFLNQSNRPVTQADTERRAKFAADVKALEAKIANEYGHQDSDYTTPWVNPDENAAKKLIADAVVMALAEIERQKKVEIAQLKDETTKADRLLVKQAKAEQANLAKDAKTASDKVLAAAKVAASKV